MALPKERIVFDHRSVPTPDDAIAIVQGRPRPREPQPQQIPPSQAPASTRLVQRADLERLRRRLAEPCALAHRDLLTLLAYAIGGDGDPVVGLLEDVRATIAMLGETPADGEPSVFASLERRVAVALELHSRATTPDR